MALNRDEIGLSFRIEAETKGVEQKISSLRSVLNSQLDDIQQSVRTRLGVFGEFIPEFGRVEAGLSGIDAASGAATGGISRMGIAFGVAGAAASVITAALIDSAKAAADFGGEIFDLTQKTSLSAETLSTLKAAAEQSGSSLKDVGSAVTVLNRRMAEAVEGNQKLQEKFQSLGIEITGSTEEALRVIIRRFAEMEDGAEKVKLAVDLFGKSGANLIPTLDALEGNLDGQIEKMRELGLVIDNEAAKAADDFGDKVQLLDQRFKGLKVTIGNQVIPALTSMIDLITEGIRGIQDLSKVSLEADRNAAAARANLAFNPLATAPGVQEGLKRVIADAERRRARGRAEREALTGVFDEITSGDLAKNAVAIEAKRNARNENDDDGSSNRRRTRGAGRRTTKEPARDDFDQKAREGLVKVQQDQQRETERRNKAAQQSDQEFFRDIIRSREAFNRQQSEIQRINDDAEIAGIQEQTRCRIITEQEAVVQIAAIRAAAFAQREDDLNSIVAGGDITKVATAQEELKRLGAERAAFEEEAIRKLRAAKDADLEKERQELEERRRLTSELIRQRTEALSGIFTPEAATQIATIEDALGRQLNLWEQNRVAVLSYAQTLQNEAAEALQRITNITGIFQVATSSAIDAFVSSGGSLKAAKQVLVQALAAPFIEAATTRAKFEAAAAFASLAALDFRGALLHGLAATGFAALAAGGNALVSGGLSGSGAAAVNAAGSNNSFERRERRVIEQGNRDRERVDIFIHPGPEFEATVKRAVIRDYQTNGETRRLIRDDGVL